MKFLKVTAVKDGEVIGPGLIAIDSIAYVVDRQACREIGLLYMETAVLKVSESFDTIVAALSQ